MALAPANRLYIRRILRLRLIRVALLLFLLFNFIDVLRIHHNISHNVHRRSKPSSPSRPHERVYIASMHFNNGRILRSHWNDAVIKLTETFGPNNVFVSIFESGSWDDSKEVLRELDRDLERRGVPHRVEVSDVTHQDELNNAKKGEGWVDTPRNKRELRRIPYLSKLRNKTIKDLLDLHKQGIEFDKVLFLNDVVFTVEDVLTLMDTNGGEYAAACSLDFSKPPLYYDTFALRDIEGHGHVSQTWPYFKARASRNALVGNLDAVPVTSCWNGIVVMPAEPFVSSTKLRFRGVPDSLAKHHLEGSECCLIHADNPLSRTLGVFLNPRVRVGYNPAAYDATHPAGSWVSTWEIFTGIWKNRLKRWTSVTFEGMVVRSRVRHWENEASGNREPGVFCLINEMQVLAHNGWAHV
ncbi:glycosyltransferase family 69 protein [Metarhizium rileyi]|uniref:Glycosyltransferase family 69 protein n=1 Tax=Metarhizium rileyi (strain RCEF 4871) TaxID=1649241 RepID=A0A162JT18_METRR|nr:glycosyltransferase family 69 protein [Metarhizium rileyi RCEF 4871]